MAIKGLYKKRDWYYYQPSRKGGIKVSAIALGTKDVIEAISKVKDLIRDGITVQSNDNLKSAFAAYRKHKKDQGRGARTLRGYDTVGAILLDHFGNIRVNKFTEGKILEWQDELRKQSGRSEGKKTPNTVHNYMQGLRGFLTWAVKIKMINDHPMKGILQRRPRATKREAFLTVEERERLLEGPFPNKDVETILWLGLFAGLRFIEMTAIRPVWISSSGGIDVIKVQEDGWFMPKDKEARAVPIPSRLRQYILTLDCREKYFIGKGKEFKPDKPAWYRYNPRHSFIKYCDSKGVGWLRYHGLRHTYLTMHASAGTSIQQLAMWSGTDAETLHKHYFGFLPSVKDVEAIC